MNVRTGIGAYILDENNEPRAEPDIMGWGQWMETHDRHVAMDFQDDARVSTVFLGLDHRFFGDGPPILFETMIFGGRHDSYQERYATKAEAEAGHARALALVRETP
jgi:hypothetical protein